jgi:hypothetical protein
MDEIQNFVDGMSLGLWRSLNAVSNSMTGGKSEYGPEPDMDTGATIAKTAGAGISLTGIGMLSELYGVAQEGLMAGSLLLFVNSLAHFIRKPPSR